MIRIGISKKEFPKAVGIRQCPNCGKETMMIRKVYKSVFTIWYIPIIPIFYGRKDFCLSCGSKNRVKGFKKDITKEFIDTDPSQYVE